MKRLPLYITLAIIGVALVIVIVSFTTLSASKSGIVEGKIFDELSGDPVRGVRIVIDGRSTVLYHTTEYQLTKIPPGEWTMQVSPPTGWLKFTKTLKVKSGKNTINIPLKGDKVPDLTGIICFTDSDEKGITIEVRYVDSKGIGMTEFPRLPVKIEITLWERIGEEDNYKKGRKLFEGPVEEFWDSKAYLAKNKGFISWDKIPVRFKEKKYGVMEIRVHLKQGDFKDTVDDVQLFPAKKEASK